jgi:hypothetical protein
VGSWEGEKVGGLEEHRAKSRGQKTEYGMRKWAEDRFLKSEVGIRKWEMIVRQIIDVGSGKSECGNRNLKVEIFD